MKKITLSFLALASTLMITNCASKSTTADQSSTAIVEKGPVSLTIVSPKEGDIITDTNVPVTFELKNYEVKPGGAHIHVILDNEPYQPCFDVSQPFILKDLKPGIHTIRAFPSTAWHESIKDPTAFADVKFYVEKKEGKSTVNFEKDMVLTYSRPKGKYEGEKAKKIIFDFWIKNVVLSADGYKVKYTLDKLPAQMITEWKPLFFEGLTAGKHKLMIDLVNKKGKSVKGEFNKTTREFEVAP